MNKVFASLAKFVGDISPKLKASLVWGALATLAIGWLNSVTPEDLTWAGPAEPLLFSSIPIVVGAIAAWVKADPLRAEGAASLAAKAEKAAAEAEAAAKSLAPAPVATPEPTVAPVEPPAAPPAA